jgi:tRNA threonylcarbamoyladenosine biosynthesis protein TsaB
MNEKIILALDSSTIRASVAVARGPKVLAELFITRQRSHSEQMHAAVEEVLSKVSIQLSDLDAIAVTHGPGSFTGLRVAGNIAKTFSYILDIPLLSINTLEALALQSPLSLDENRMICPMVNAFKQMVFLALYNRDKAGFLTEVIKPSLFSLEQLASVITEEVECIGDAFDYYKEELNKSLVERLCRTELVCDYPLPENIIALAFKKLNLHETIVWNQFTPLYLKSSEAEENLRKGLLHVRRLGV